MAKKRKINSYGDMFNVWYTCKACHISMSYGPVEYDGFIPKCPDCKDQMIKE